MDPSEHPHVAEETGKGAEGRKKEDSMSMVLEVQQCHWLNEMMYVDVSDKVQEN